MEIDYYSDLAVDLLMAGDLSLVQAKQIVNYLKDEGLIDYDVLKEYYTDE